MKRTIVILLAVLLCAACAPKVDPQPVDFDPDLDAPTILIVDTSGNVLADTHAEPTEPCGWGLQSWPRHEVTEGGQEIGVAVDLCNTLIVGQYVTICVAADCQTVITGCDGQAYAKFDRAWQTGAVPVTACVEGTCLQYSFMAVEALP